MTLHASIKTIPAWNGAGALPPIRPFASGSSMDRSPYPVALETVVDHFAQSPERRAILDGLLRYRGALHQVGLVSGFQWFDGSFLEQVELLEGRPPRDIDVVTFFKLPSAHNQRSLVEQHPALFNNEQVKNNYLVDAYFHQLGEPLDAISVKSVSYWYSMWSHRRSGLWKGFVQVDLDPAQDERAREILDSQRGNGHD